MIEDLQEIQRMLDEEAAEWDRTDISLDNISATNGSIFQLKVTVQAMLNCLLKNGLITEDDINLENKNLLYNEMVYMRTQMIPELRQRRIRAMLGEPEPSKLIGPDGSEIKL